MNMTTRENEIHDASREFSDERDNRMSFAAGARWADKNPNAVDMGYLQDWYQNSIDATQEPVWTDKHLEELFEDFWLIPKKI